MAGKLILLAILLGLPCACLATPADCDSVPGVSRFYSQGWGLGAQNHRFQPAENTRVNAGNVASLELAWAFGFDGDSPHSYPLVSEDTVFIGSESGMLYALDRESGCIRWQFEADGDIRTAIEHGLVEVKGIERTLLFFGTFEATAYAVDAQTGAQVWQREMDEHRFALVTGSPVFHDGRLFVPLSAYEVIVAMVPFYECCTFRGSIVALDASSGAEIWRQYTVDEVPAVTGTRGYFFDIFGPSGAPVWQSPVLDVRRKRLYFATGENYSDPATDTSDAVFAMDMEDGSVLWHRQFTAGDAWNSACGLGVLGANCPEADGPDFDFGAPPILTRMTTGANILLAGQKSSMVHAMDPDSGEVIWQQRVGRGGKLGGIHWGMAVNEARGLLFVPISDRGAGDSSEHPRQPGLHALNIDDGSLKWSVASNGNCENREGCDPGVSAALIATDDLVFAGGLDGGLQAYAADDGTVLWRFDSWRSYTAANGVDTTGGPIDVHGPMLADDMLFVTSGYGTFGQQGGNAFLAFRLKR